MEQVRVCTIGAGQMANRVHYPSLASFEDVEMVAGLRHRRGQAPRNRGAMGDPSDVCGLSRDGPIRATRCGLCHRSAAPDVRHLGVVPEPGLQPLHRKADGAHAPPGTHAGLSRGRARRRDPGEPSAEVEPTAPARLPGVHGREDQSPTRSASSTSAPPRPCSARETT